MRSYELSRPNDMTRLVMSSWRHSEHD